MKSRQFTSRKRKTNEVLSTNPETKRVRQWEQSQTGFDAAKLKVNRNARQRKKRALERLRNSKQYSSGTAAEQEVALAKTIAELEARREKELDVAAKEWNAVVVDSSDASNDGLDESLVWDTPDEDEPDKADPNYEVDDEIAETEGEPHEVDDEGKIKLDGEAALALEAIMQKPNRRHARFLKRIEDLNAPHEDEEVVWSPSEGSDESGGDLSLREETEEEWDGIPDE